MSTDSLVTTELLDDAYVVSVRGELDVANADVLAEKLRWAQGRSLRSVIVDLSECEFLDSSAVKVLVGANRDLAGLCVVTDNENLLRLLAIMSLDHVFRIAPDRATALRGD